MAATRPLRLRLARFSAFAGALGPLATFAVPALFGVGPGCVCNGGAHGLPPQAGLDFGDVGRVHATDAASELGVARALVDRRSDASDAGNAGTPANPASSARDAAAAAGGRRRVVLGLFRAGIEPVVATAIADSETEAVVSAARALAPKITGTGAGGRLELDVPTTLESADLEDEMTAPLTSIGLQGVLVTRDDGRAGAVLASEIAERGLFQFEQQGKSTHLDRDRIVHLLAERAGVSREQIAAMRAYLFRSDAYVESPDGPLRVVRGMVAHPASATPEGLLAAVRLGAEYLCRILDSEGRYVYLYHPLDDRNDTQYGWLRHAGTTYALLEAYEEFGTARYLEKAELALRYLAAHLHEDHGSDGKYALDTHDEEQQKVGGAGLALLAFAKHAAVTGKRDHLETMRALARFIVKQEYEDGHFRANADLEKETGKQLKREPVYYPGEAALGLLRLYAIDPQPQYLDTARRAADWVVQVRDAFVSEDNQEHDHWMSYAYNELYRITHDGAYLEHAFKIGRAIEKKRHRAEGAPAPDWAGTFFEGQTTPASTRVEAYDADIALSRFAGKPEAWLLGPAQEVACSMLGQQFRADNDYFVSNPAKAEGGVRESLFVQDVRIDYVQHAMSAWLHLARILRDPAYGKSGVPSQDPVRDPVR